MYNDIKIEVFSIIKLFILILEHYCLKLINFQIGYFKSFIIFKQKFGVACFTVGDLNVQL